MRSVVAITGASGALYGVRLLQELPGERILVMSETAKRIIPAETGYSVEQVEGLADAVYSDDDLAAHLNQQGYQVARRTIAKYREILNIPNSRLRRH